MFTRANFRLLIVVILICFVCTPLLQAYEYTNDWIYENYPDSVRERGAAIYGGNNLEYGPGGMNPYVFISDPDVNILYLSTVKSTAVDSIRLWDGTVIPGSTRDVMFEDSTLINYFIEIGATALIRRVPNVVPGEVTEVIDYSGGSMMGVVDLSSHYEVQFPDTLEVNDVIADLMDILPASCYVMPKPIVIDFGEGDPPPEYVCDESRYYDEHSDEQWYMWPQDTINGGGIDLDGAREEACAYIDVSDATVAIIDAGFGRDPGFHPDFNPNVNFEKSRVERFNNVGCHGLYVTGVIGSAAGNHPLSAGVSKISAGRGGIGIIGGAPTLDLILLSHFNQGGYIKCFKYVIDSCPEVDVINCSWGILYPDPALLEVMLVGYLHNNIIYVCSGGNCTIFTRCPFGQWPAAFGQTDYDPLPDIKDFVITVPYCNNKGQQSSGSNYGEYMDIAAPGLNIFTTGPQTKFPATLEEEHGYCTQTGTSLSAPQIAAVVALMKSIRPDLPNSTIYSLVIKNIYPAEGWTEWFGYGISDARAAVNAVKNLYCNTIPGDINGDCHTNTGDIMYFFRYLYKGGPPPPVPDEMVDVNCDGTTNLLDITYLITYLWLGGPVPGECGTPSPRQIPSFPQITLQNYPNPFNPATTFSFAMLAETHVNLTIYNILGQKVIELINESLPAGKHDITWDGSDSHGNKTASGMYFAKFHAGDYSVAKKMMIVK